MSEWKHIPSIGPNFYPQSPRVGMRVRISPERPKTILPRAYWHLIGEEGEVREIVESSVSFGYGDQKGWKLRIDFDNEDDDVVIGNWFLEKEV